MTQAPTLTAWQPEDAFGKVSKRHLDSKLWGLDLKPAFSDFELILFFPLLFGSLVQVTCRAQGGCPRSENGLRKVDLASSKPWSCYSGLNLFLVPSEGL